MRRRVNTKIKVNVNEDKENKDTCFSKKPFILSNKYFSIYGLYLRSTHYTYKYAFFFLCRSRSDTGEYTIPLLLIIDTLTNKRRAKKKTKIKRQQKQRKK